MGYRSDVTAAFYVSKVEQFPLLKLWLTENFPMDTFHDNIRWFDRGMLVEEHDTKWYDDYEEVKAFDAAVNKFLGLVHKNDVEQDAPKFSYEFVRIGENYDDVDTQYEGDACEWLLGVDRSITIGV